MKTAELNMFIDVHLRSLCLSKEVHQACGDGRPKPFVFNHVHGEMSPWMTSFAEVQRAELFANLYIKEIL